MPLQSLSSLPSQVLRGAVPSAVPRKVIRCSVLLPCLFSDAWPGSRPCCIHTYLPLIFCCLFFFVLPHPSQARQPALLTASSTSNYSLNLTLLSALLHLASSFPGPVAGPTVPRNRRACRYPPSRAGPPARCWKSTGPSCPRPSGPSTSPDRVGAIVLCCDLLHNLN